MNLQSVLNAYQQSANLASLLQALKQEQARVQLKGLVGSSAAFVAAAQVMNSSGLHVFVLHDKEEAAYFLNDLEQLLGDNQVLFFPSAYKKPYQIEEVDNANVLLRAEVLNALNRSQSIRALVTYPQALSAQVVTKQVLTKNTLELNQGAQLSLEFINEALNEYGFSRVDFVVEPGQFSIRGGIVDIFSFSNDLPYRVEFFGDDIESIRVFDPSTQLSVAQKNQIQIVPNVQDALLNEARQPLLDYIGTKATLWFNGLEFCLGQLTKEFDETQRLYDLEKGLIKQLPPDALLVSAEVFMRSLTDYPVVEFGSRFFMPKAQTVSFDIAPQPAFKKNFELLTQNLHENEQQQITNLLFTDTPRQVERLHAIFQDIGKEIQLTPLNVSIHEGFIDKQLKLACYTDHQLFERYHRFKLKSGAFKKNEALTLKELKGLNPGDYVTHIDYGVGKYAGLELIEVNGKMQETIRLVYKDNDVLNISIHSLHRISKYSGKEGVEPKINKLGSNAWATLKQKTKKKVKEIAFDLIKLYAERKARKGFAYSPDTYLQNELEASFIYEDTPDQEKSTRDVKRDMESATPMDRLVCGDVGFGKTEVAIRAAFKAVADSKQVAVLVPTTILALQHYKTFKERLKDLPCTVDYINRFKSAKEQKETLKKLSEGKVDILIGTHRIVGKDVQFKDLGLLIIDEEQKFGVSVKDKLKTFKVNVDTLTLTATPIPRTLQFSMMAARDLSVIATPPPNRYPVQTELHTFNEEIIRDAIRFEVDRGGQVFFIHNRVQSIQEVSGIIQRLCPDVRVLTAHGQMDGDKLEEAMLAFIEGSYDVLVATTIIESGLDIPNANTILINNAHLFGLSDLHQMRGRVGRSNKKAFCYLLTQPVTLLTEEARKRLKAIEEFSDLGSGFQIAMRDLDIRGAGNLLGGEQSGFITEIGFDMYQKILDEAIQELKESEFQDLFAGELQEKLQTAEGSEFVKDCLIDTDLEILLPDGYVNNITERLSLYRDLDNTPNEEALLAFEKQLTDRFGPLPDPARDLLLTIRLRWTAQKIGFEKLILKNGKMIGYFVANQQSPFYQSAAFTKVLRFVQARPHECKMREAKERLTLSFDQVKDVTAALATLKEVQAFG